MKNSKFLFSYHICANLCNFHDGEYQIIVMAIFLGSSLAQDRGRLEAKIETLTIEVATLKKLLEVNVDFRV